MQMSVVSQAKPLPIALPLYCYRRFFSENSGPLEMLEAPGKQQFRKGEIQHLLAT